MRSKLEMFESPVGDMTMDNNEVAQTKISKSVLVNLEVVKQT